MTTTRLEPGTPAPDFSLTDQDGSTVTLADLRGTGAILFFYPAAMTPGCTTEACDFRDSIGPIQAAGYRVLGVSRDDLAKLREFRERDGLTYDLLSDPDHAVHSAYGAWGEKVTLIKYGLKQLWAVPSTVCGSPKITKNTTPLSERPIIK